LRAIINVFFIDRVNELAQVWFGNLKKVLKGKHEIADIDGQRWLLRFDRFEYLSRRRWVKPIH